LKAQFAQSGNIQGAPISGPCFLLVYASTLSRVKA
jgi:hypothetical protein